MIPRARDGARTRDPRPGGERGAVAVEFALVMVLLLIVIVGILAVGVPMATRVRLSDATRRVAREAAADRVTDESAIQDMLRARMGDSLCEQVFARVEVKADPARPATEILSVTGVCSLNSLFGASLGLVALDKIEVHEDVPFQPWPKP